MNGIYLLLGSNIGNRLEYLIETEKLLIQKKIKVIDESSVYETEPWGNENQDWFLNIVLQIETSLTAKQLLKVALEVEKEIGRIREEKWGARCIDVDILYYNEEII
ncbi:MAG: 2-amino-4-hydroxy-6-hydroxymethyldihydropteridine diphosphokinase, partial [Bacteroidota bacterium]